MFQIEELADCIIKDAVKNDVSDIHIIPRKEDTIIQYRIGNKLFSRYRLPQDHCERLISHFKFTAAMDIGERRRPQSGSYSTVVNDQSVGLRLSTLPSLNKESLVISNSSPRRPNSLITNIPFSFNHKKINSFASVCSWTNCLYRTNRER